jgi:hypothetical protein
VSLDPVTAGLDLARTVVQTIWPDKTEQEKAALAATLQLQLAQVDVDKAEASSSSVFTSGWRPFIGWVCGLGFAVQFLVGPLGTWSAALAGHAVAFPQLDLASMLPVLGGMLGLGTLRTFEKVKGVA